MSSYKDVPDFDSLPKVKGMPQGCCWGIFDKDGKKDHLGTLNYLTPDVVKEAVSEVKEGVSVSLNWPIGAIKTPGFGRKGLDHKVLDFMDSPFKIHGFDDEVSFNTQCSSQWDSLCHFAHQPTGLSYNGVKPTAEGLVQDFGTFDHEKALPTLNHWHESGGLVARGVLLDYVAYAEAKGIKYSPFENHPINVDTLEAMAKHQGTTFKHGDVLLVRCGSLMVWAVLRRRSKKRCLGRTVVLASRDPRLRLSGYGTIISRLLRAMQSHSRTSLLRRMAFWARV